MKSITINEAFSVKSWKERSCLALMTRSGRTSSRVSEKRKLRNITIKLDPLYLLSIKKVATKKGIPYQTLVRQRVAENIRKELKLA